MVKATWNKENRFTGWTDVDLSERGVKEAIEAGKTLKEAGFRFQDRIYLLSHPGHPDIVADPGADGPSLDPGLQDLAAE